MKKENYKGRKETNSGSISPDKTKKRKSALAASDKARSATERVSPRSNTALSKGMADTGTNVSYEETE